MGGPGGDGASVPLVSVVLATLNEHANLPILIDALRATSLASYELLVVDDGSTDGTREYLTKESARDPRVRPVFHDGKQTTLKAQCQGIGLARGRYIVVMDADRQHPAPTVPRLVAELERGASLAVASRYAPGGSVGPRTWTRALISYAAEATAKVALTDARGLTDPVSGFFAFRREVFRPLDPEVRGYKLLLFLLVMNHGRTTREVGFVFEPRGSGASKVTQGFGFVRVFLAELGRARRLARRLRAERAPSSARGGTPP